MKPGQAISLAGLCTFVQLNKRTFPLRERHTRYGVRLVSTGKTSQNARDCPEPSDTRGCVIARNFRKTTRTENAFSITQSTLATQYSCNVNNLLQKGTTLRTTSTSKSLQRFYPNSNLRPFDESRPQDKLLSSQSLTNQLNHKAINSFEEASIVGQANQ